jgi:hypothetical protein
MEGSMSETLDIIPPEDGQINPTTPLRDMATSPIYPAKFLWESPRGKKIKRNFVLGCSAATLLGIVFFTFSQYTQMRGIASVIGARCFLILTTVGIIGLIFIGATLLPVRRKWRTVLGFTASVLIIYALYRLELWATSRQTALQQIQLAKAPPQQSEKEKEIERHSLAADARYVGKGLGELAGNYSHLNIPELLELWRTKELPRVQALRSQLAKYELTDEVLDKYGQPNAVTELQQIADMGAVLIRMSDALYSTVPPVAVMIEGHNKVDINGIKTDGAETIIKGENEVKIKDLDNTRTSGQPNKKPKKKPAPNQSPTQ